MIVLERKTGATGDVFQSQFRSGLAVISAGLGRSIWSIVAQGSDPAAADTESLKTLDYGGGARWFAKRHLAFSLDVRVYAIPAGTPQLGLSGSPRAALLVIGAGISVK